jgi:hypothetical protein
VVANLDHSAKHLLNGLTEEPAWPTLRGHMLLLAAAGADPVAELFSAAATRELTSAHDQAAVIDWRIVNEVVAGGPLPWLSGIPHRLAADPDWGPYLDARSQLVAELADQIRRNAAAEAPAWAAQPRTPVPAELIADVQVWRAATQVDPDELRPTGPPQLAYAGRTFQQQLDKRLAAPDTNADGQWRRLLATEAPSAADPFLPELEERLSNLTRAGFDATQRLRSAAAARPLPDDHPAQPCGGASSTSYRKRRTRNPPPLRRSRRPVARARCHSTGSRPCRARHRPGRSARAADLVSRRRTSAERFGRVRCRNSLCYVSRCRFAPHGRSGPVLAALRSGPHGQGAMPGRHLSDPYLAAQLAARGLYARQARNTALAAFASDLPAPVMADLLGMRINTAVTWGRL